jgi:hypothetical protein
MRWKGLPRKTAVTLHARRTAAVSLLLIEAAKLKGFANPIVPGGITVHGVGTFGPPTVREIFAGCREYLGMTPQITVDILFELESQGFLSLAHELDAD